MRFFAELQRRHVYKVGAMYAVAGWLLVQVVTQVLPVFNVSAFDQRILVLIVVAGFPVALVLAWIFDLTPLGIVRTGDADGDTVVSRAGERGRSLDRRFNYVLGGLLILALGYLVFERTLPGVGPSGPDPANGKSVAVLPFENFGGDPKNAYFAEGIRDEILTKLTGLNDLKVISRTSADRYKSRPENLKTVAAELGVNAFLEGSVQIQGDAVHVNVQLINALDDSHLWAETYDRLLSNVFAVEGEVGLDIARAMHARLAPAQADALALAPTNDPLAYDDLLKGESRLRRAIADDDAEEYGHAAAFFQEAVLHDPQFIQGFARLAYALLSQYWSDAAKPADLLARAKTAADRAMTLGPESAAAHLAYGYYHYYSALDYSSAEIEFKRTLTLQPQNTEARVAMALIERRQGHWEEARVWLDQALKLDPLNPVTLKIATHVNAAMRDYVRANAWIAQRRKLDPEAAIPIGDSVFNLLARTGDVDAAMQILDDLPPGVRKKRPLQDLRIKLLTYQRQFKIAAEAIEAMPDHADDLDDLAFCYERLQEPENAKAANRQALKVLDGLAPAEQQTTDVRIARARVLAGLGHGEEAIVLVQAALASIPESKAFDGSPRKQAAEIYAMLRRPAAAVTLLKGLLSEYSGSVICINGLKIEPAWDPIRDDPSFKALLAGSQASSVQ